MCCVSEGGVALSGSSLPPSCAGDWFARWSQQQKSVCGIRCALVLVYFINVSVKRAASFPGRRWPQCSHPERQGMLWQSYPTRLNGLW